MDHNVPFELRWSQTRGWLRFRDPVTHRWDEVAAVDVPAWKKILVRQLREDGWHPHDHDDGDDADGRLSCGCVQEHDSCAFGLGLDCLHGDACTNPHHFGRSAP